MLNKLPFLPGNISMDSDQMLHSVESDLVLQFAQECLTSTQMFINIVNCRD